MNNSLKNTGRFLATLSLAALIIASCSTKKSLPCDKCDDIRECPQCPIGLVSGTQDNKTLGQ